MKTSIVQHLNNEVGRIHGQNKVNESTMGHWNQMLNDAGCIQLNSDEKLTLTTLKNNTTEVSLISLKQSKDKSQINSTKVCSRNEY